jgi:predicted phosphodiesterase
MVLIFSDLHLADTTSSAKGVSHGAWSRLENQIHLVRQIEKIVSQHRVEHIWFLGDMIEALDFKVTEKVYEAAFDLTRRLAQKAEFRFVLGNHDVWKGLVERSNLMSIAGVHVIQQTSSVRMDGRRVDIVPWDSPLPRKRGDVLLGHFTVYGSYLNAARTIQCTTGITFNDLVHPDDLKGYEYVFVGHNHLPQDLDIPGAKDARHVGSVTPPTGGNSHSYGRLYLFEDGKTSEVKLDKNLESDEWDGQSPRDET